MPLKAIPPGTRKAYPFYMFRGRVDGKLHEIRTELPTGTSAKTLRAACEEAERLIRQEASRVSGPEKSITFRQAAALYVAYRNPAVADRKRIEKIFPGVCEGLDFNPKRRIDCGLGDKLVSEIVHADLVDAARQLFPDSVAASKNRDLIRPAAAILHYASVNGWCAWLRISPFKEPKPRTRAVAEADVPKIIRAAPEGSKRLLLVWLFRQGNRISDVLRVNWNQIDLQDQLVMKMRIGKKDVERDKPLDPELIEMLSAIPEPERVGPIFPWRYNSGVHYWLHPLMTKIGIKFTPHMARHTLGTALNRSGAGLRTIMAALDHDDPKSSIRYQDADIETVRAAMLATRRTKGSVRERDVTNSGP